MVRHRLGRGVLPDHSGGGDGGVREPVDEDRSWPMADGLAAHMTVGMGTDQVSGDAIIFGLKRPSRSISIERLPLPTYSRADRNPL